MLYCCPSPRSNQSGSAWVWIRKWSKTSAGIGAAQLVARSRCGPVALARGRASVHHIRHRGRTALVAVARKPPSSPSF